MKISKENKANISCKILQERPVIRNGRKQRFSYKDSSKPHFPTSTYDQLGFWSCKCLFSIKLNMLMGKHWFHFFYRRNAPKYYSKLHQRRLLEQSDFNGPLRDLKQDTATGWTTLEKTSKMKSYNKSLTLKRCTWILRLSLQNLQ